jgi:hypothetical protein
MYIASMALPSEQVNLSIEQINELNQRLATMRHDVNNHLALMNAAAELIRRRPETADRLMGSLMEQPPKISETIAQFSRELESALHITKP